MDSTDLIKGMNKFFTKRTLASTYKPYFLKSILELSGYQNGDIVGGRDWIKRTDSGLLVKLDFIASRFGFHYWDPHFKFRLKQSANPHEDVHIYRILDDMQRDLGGRGNRPKITVFCSPKYANMRSRIISKCIKPDVLKRLLKDCPIYEVSNDENSISVSYEILRYMKLNKPALEKAIDFVITEYLEGRNSSPQIATKISEKKPPSNLNKSVFRNLVQSQSGTCFYCKKRSIDVQEHVLPKDYVWETKPYNIVGSCEKCNREKWHDKLPTRRIFERVLNRNDTLLEMMKWDGYSRMSYEMQYKNCKTDYARGFWKPS